MIFLPSSSRIHLRSLPPFGTLPRRASCRPPPCMGRERSWSRVPSRWHTWGRGHRGWSCWWPVPCGRNVQSDRCDGGRSPTHAGSRSWWRRWQTGCRYRGWTSLKVGDKHSPNDLISICQSRCYLSVHISKTSFAWSNRFHVANPYIVFKIWASHVTSTSIRRPRRL